MAGQVKYENNVDEDVSDLKFFRVHVLIQFTPACTLGFYITSNHNREKEFPAIEKIRFPQY